MLSVTYVDFSAGRGVNVDVEITRAFAAEVNECVDPVVRFGGRISEMERLRFSICLNASERQIGRISAVGYFVSVPLAERGVLEFLRGESVVFVAHYTEQPLSNDFSTRRRPYDQFLYRARIERHPRAFARF